jgi:hypothetical protein
LVSELLLDWGSGDTFRLAGHIQPQSNSNSLTKLQDRNQLTDAVTALAPTTSPTAPSPGRHRHSPLFHHPHRPTPHEPTLTQLRQIADPGSPNGNHPAPQQATLLDI